MTRRARCIRSVFAPAVLATALSVLSCTSNAVAQAPVDIRLRMPTPDDHPASTSTQPTFLPDEGGPPPPGWRRDRWTRSDLWTAGTVTMGLAYGLTLVAGGAMCGRRFCDFALVPLAGPVILMADPRFSTHTETVVALVVLGVAQLTGTVLVASGVVLPRRVFVPVLPEIRITPVAYAPSNEAGVALGLAGFW